MTANQWLKIARDYATEETGSSQTDDWTPGVVHETIVRAFLAGGDRALEEIEKGRAPRGAADATGTP